MGRRSEMAKLLEPIEASELSRERLKVMLLTLAGSWSVKEGLERLSLSRTRFQVLRKRMLEGALCSLEPGATGRPRTAPSEASEAVRKLQAHVAELRHELRLLRTKLEIEQSAAARAVRLRTTHLLAVKRRSER